MKKLGGFSKGGRTLGTRGTGLGLNISSAFKTKTKSYGAKASKKSSPGKNFFKKMKKFGFSILKDPTK